MHKVYTLLLITATCLYTTTTAKTRKVLFLGNSYTHVNGMANMVNMIATSFNDTLIIGEVSPGGFTLQGHSGNAASLNAIKQDKWDVVVLQEQSQLPSFPPADVAQYVLPYAKKLDSLIRLNDSCTETMFYMTWGRKNGDASNCAVNPPVCTYAGMQAELRKSYLLMAQNNNAVVAPVGAAWRLVRDSLPGLNLYDPDESHPSVAGTYLAACVFYASIFHKDPHGSSYTAGLPATDAERLQYFARKTVLDSIDSWIQYGEYVYTNFSYTKTGHQVTFQNNSINAGTYLWQFGDGNTSTQANPVHTYTQAGKYQVTLSASKNCRTSVMTDSITVGNVGITALTSPGDHIAMYREGAGKMALRILSSNFTEVVIYNSIGNKMRSYFIQKDETIYLQDLAPGLYIIHLTNGTQRLADKFVVY